MRTLLRLVVGIIVAVVLIAVPLLIVQQAECPRGDRFEDEWAIALPGREGFDSDCREPESGAERLLEFVRGA